MTVSASEARAGPYTGNDSASSFAFSFRVFSDANLRVVETVTATGVETDLVLNTDYTVTRNVNQDTNPGGSVVYKVGGVTTALPSTKKLTIVGDFAYEQPTDIPNGGSFFADTVELALDRVTLLTKQLKEAVDRAIKVNVSSTTTPDELIADLIEAAADADAAAAAAAASQGAAATSETNAAASAAAAAVAAASIGYKDVVYLTSADSPRTVTQADSGKLLSVDTSSGAVTVNLPTISGLSLPYVVGVKKSTADGNAVTVNRGGSDTFDDGTTSQSLTSTNGMTLIPDTDGSPDKWSVLRFGTVTGDQKKQQFTAGVDFTAGSSTTLTLSETPVAPSKDSLTIYFDAAYQQEDTWSYSASTGIVSFTGVIPLGVAKVEAKWTTPLAIGTPADSTVTPAKMVNAGAEYASYNRVTNGDFSILQRGLTAFTDDTYCFDRWYVLVQSGSLDSLTQQTDQQTGQPTNIRISWTNSALSSRRFGVAQIIESINIRDLRSTSSVLSGKVSTNRIGTTIKCAILEWTGTADSVTSDVVNDWTSTNYTSGNFFIAGVNVISVGTVVTSGVNTFADISCTGTFGSSMNNAIVMFWPEGAMGGDSSVFNMQVGLVQLEQGSTKTPFKRVSYQQQLAECQRFYETGEAYLNGYGEATQVMGYGVEFKVSKRATPIMTSSFTYTNSGSGAVSQVTASGFRPTVQVTGTGAYNFGMAWTASSDL